MNQLPNDLLILVEKRREGEGSKDYFMDKILDQKEKQRFSRHQLCFLGGAMMKGASDTSSSVIVAFVQAMTKWTLVQTKAQKGIDTVICEQVSCVVGLCKAALCCGLGEGSAEMETSGAPGISTCSR